MMKCIAAARTSLFYNIQQQHYHHRRNSETRSWPKPHRRLYASTQTTTQALLLSDLVLVLAEVNIIPQPKGDITVFLKTGGLLLSAYLLANFVVPSIVLKQLDAAAKEPESTVKTETSNEQQPPKKMKKKNQG